ncbi:hypothetical protein BDV27DRAFT_152069 [Aspergillus caelatus]|uniref:F-box domain-containing protein n=1 Tax=Aspergillus caelatus TaxID=61420 RepID=A0A5N7AKL9_9EURO|nr:uncharacterized protein BDV27DRAFT_152069 [Aspergillus caelatus]KAE8370474.1 hypothetical protein BDV27DRAFT_152069 [Aspergillus caelatus]
MDRLPNELIFLVGKYIKDDVFAKLALSQCSRRLQWLFDPPLAYSYLYISSIGTREFALIRHLWCRPDLARLVQHAYLGFAWCFRPDSQPITEACYPQWNWMVEHILDDICESEYEKTAWNMQLRRFCEEAWLGVLLTRLNNLKSVTLAYGNNQGLINSILDKAAYHRQPFNRTTPFQLLLKVTLKSQFSWLQCNLPFAMGLFHLPAIRTIQGIKNMGLSFSWNEPRNVEFLRPETPPEFSH